MFVLTRILLHETFLSEFNVCNNANDFFFHVSRFCSPRHNLYSDPSKGLEQSIHLWFKVNSKWINNKQVKTNATTVIREYFTWLGTTALLKSTTMNEQYFLFYIYEIRSTKKSLVIVWAQRELSWNLRAFSFFEILAAKLSWVTVIWHDHHVLSFLNTLFQL